MIPFSDTAPAIRSVLYLYIYIALIECRLHQSEALPGQGETHREKRAVLKERKEALGSPVSKVDRVEGGS